MRPAAGWTAASLVLTASAIIVYKLFFAGYSLSSISPVVAYDVRTLIRFEGHDDPVTIHTFFPVSNDRQVVREEDFSAEGLSQSQEFSAENRRITWGGDSVRGPGAVSASYRVSTRPMRYVLPDAPLVRREPPPGIRRYLDPTDTIQSQAPEIGALLDRIAPPPRRIETTLKAIFDYTHDALEPLPFKGTTDALTALRLGQASCNGKSRLFAALARRAGLPARLIGGLILGNGTKRTSHQWLEVWVNGIWVPFGPLNGHFAEVPGRFLRLYTGDEVLFSHSPNINFDYQFSIRRRLAARDTLSSGAEPPPWASLRLWALFGRIGIPLDLLRILIMLPLGATVTVIFRNVIGLQVYGTFLPALLAVAFRGTGLGWGAVGFGLLLLLISLARLFLDRLNLLHTPKLAVMLTLVILGMIGLSATSVSFGIGTLAYVSLFPIAVITLTTERFGITIQEEGWREALLILVQTILVVAACFMVMESTALQAVFMAFPELLLVVLATDIWLGRWMGLRLIEYGRFSKLLSRGVRA